MKHVWLGLAGCALVVLLGTASLFANPEPVWLCCGDVFDCGGTGECCLYDVIGKPECDPEFPNYCAPTCKRVN